MPEFEPDFQRLLRRTLTALFVCALLVTLCYFWVDRPFAFFVHDHDFKRFAVLKWMTYPPPLLQDWAPAVLAALAVRRAWGPFRRWEHMLFAASISLLIADQFRQGLADCFGRYWPSTWIDNNPSLIQNDAYGFHPFHAGVIYGSFPSGHTARTVALVTIVWIGSPRWRWACVLATAAVVTGLLGLNYHFVGDVIAGGFVGAIVGTYTTYFCGLHQVAAVEDGKPDSAFSVDHTPHTI